MLITDNMQTTKEIQLSEDIIFPAGTVVIVRFWDYENRYGKVDIDGFTNVFVREYEIQDNS